MSRENKILPKDWKWVKVSSIAELYRGINYTKDVATNIPSKNKLPILRGNNINGELNFEDLVYVPKELIKTEQLIKKDDIIFAMSSGSKHLVGKTAVAKSDYKGSYGAFCAMLRISDDVNKQYVSYIFKGNSYRKLISEIAKGTNINNLKREHILDFEFPLPPKSTQLAIVSKIEELFSELDKAIEQLKTAQLQLKTYRQSVLKWAFEGKLTKYVRTAVRIHSAPPELSMAAEPEAAYGNSELPEGWKWVKLESIATKITDGEHITPRRTQNGVLLLSARNVQHGYLDLTNVDYVPEEEYIRISKRCKPEHDDILISCSGSVGRVSRVPANLKFSLVRSVALVKLNKEKATAKFFEYLLQSPQLQRQIEKGKKATAQANLFLGPIKNLEVLDCSIEEQNKIVQEIESRLSVADKMEESISQSLQQAEALRQSILKKAFEGRLT